jgi:hypothetical protein
MSWAIARHVRGCRDAECRNTHAGHLQEVAPVEADVPVRRGFDANLLVHV